jgi:hypothetical protein
MDKDANVQTANIRQAQLSAAKAHQLGSFKNSSSQPPFSKSSSADGTVGAAPTEALALDLLSNNFDEHALAPLAIKLTVKNLFPRAEIEFAIRDSTDDFAAHDLALEVRIRVIFAGAVMSVLPGRLVRREFLQPHVIIVQQTILRVVDVNARCGVRCPFVTAVLLPPDRCIHTAGNAPKASQQR